jgi:hypothetical protein
MIEYILLAVTIGAVCNGIYISTQEKMLFNFVRVWLNKVFITYETGGEIKHVHKLYYPILYCIKCMPSLWGTPLIIAHFGFHVELLWQLPLVLLMSVTLSSILHQQYD